MKKIKKKYNIGILPVMIDAFIEAYQTRYPLSIEDKDEAIIKIMDILHRELTKNKGYFHVSSMDAYILGKMIGVLRVPNKDLIGYFHWGMEWWEAYIPAYIRNIISNHKNMINEYVKRRPSAFSEEDKTLWAVFIENPYANPKQLIGIMGMADATNFYRACHSLINSCFSIYRVNRFKTD